MAHSQKIYSICNCGGGKMISVIVPVYNVEKYFKRCLDSIIGQTYKNLEIILIDDGSTDSSGDICDDYAKKDDRIIVIHTENHGVSSARNEGLKIAKGDYVHFPDADDYIEIDTYEYLLEIINSKKCDAVNFEHFITYPNKEIVHKYDDKRYGLFDKIDTQKQLMTGVQFTCNKLYKREIICDIRFRSDILRGEDTLFAAEVLLNADRVWFDKRPLYHYVQSENSACRGRFRRSQLTMLGLYDIYRELYAGEYQELYNLFLLQMQEQLISLYFDIWVQNENLAKEKYIIKEKFNQNYKLVKNYGNLSLKQNIKFRIFRYWTGLFCVIHKLKSWR